MLVIDNFSCFFGVSMKSLHEVCVYNCVEIKSEFIRNNLLSSVLMIASQLSIYSTATEGQPKPGGDRTGGLRNGEVILVGYSVEA